jgi:hypothetical protein
MKRCTSQLVIKRIGTMPAATLVQVMAQFRQLF